MITFTIQDEFKTKNHIVTVSATYDGKQPPKAVAHVSGLDQMQGYKYFSAKELQEAQEALDGAKDLVAAVQAKADKWVGDLQP